MTTAITEAERLPTADRRATARAAGRAVRPHAVRLAVAVLLLVGGTVAGLAAPRILGDVVDLVVAQRSAPSLVPPVVLLVAVAAGSAVLAFAGAAVLARVGQAALAGLREQVVDRALRLPAGRIERTGTGDLVARVSGDVEAVDEAVGDTVPDLVGAILQVALTAVALLLLDWRLALAALCAVPFQVSAVRRYLRTAVPIYAAERVAEGVRAQQLLDSVDGAATVRALRLGDDHVERVARTSSAARDVSVTATVPQTRFWGRLNGGELAGLTAVLVVGFLLVRADLATVGVASAAALYFHRLFNPFNTMLGLIDDVMQAGASFARLVGVADLPAPPAPAAGAASPEDGAADLRGVRHHYVSGHEVLRDVDLEVAPGERVAVVGPSGAGKTTLAKVLAGVYPPSAGTVRLGGIPVAELDAAALRRTVVLVTQEVHVFAGPLADDLRLARPDATDAELTAALARVGAEEWVATLPDGLATVVGVGGDRLTPVRAQQVALARVLLADPAVVVLDEATAEAGSAGARTLERAAEAVLDGRTAVVVAHRLSQAAHADRVVVLEAGRVVEDGPHEELADAGGTYAALWAAWSGARTPG